MQEDREQLQNRDFPFLRCLSSYCQDNGIELVLMANEFCGNGVRLAEADGYSASNCIFRDHCYQLHSLDYDKNDKLESDYPMGYCVSSRNDASVWLKMNFIRPEDMSVYNDIGIYHFKITGRTGSAAFIKKVANAYLRGGYSGNLLDLWKHLETIDADDDDSYSPRYNIPNSTLNGFIDFWTKENAVICANEICGVTCRYCDCYYKDHIIQQNNNRKTVSPLSPKG
jgi:hypothetical protein